MSRSSLSSRLSVFVFLLLSPTAFAQSRVIAPEITLESHGTVDSAALPDSSYLPRNFGAVYPVYKTPVLPVGGYGPPNFLVRPWYVAPYRYYAYYRPWYTYGYYGPSYYRYHYAPSWGHYPGPYYAPPYLSPGAYAAPDHGALYHW